MSWLPSFLTPLAAAIAAAAVIPSLLLLYFLKLRRQEMEVSSTLLWRKAIQDLQVNSPFQRLRRNLLLLLQLLLLLALAAALGRPVMNKGAQLGKLSVILVDRSASMSTSDQPKGATRLEEARRKAKELVDTLSADGSAMVIAFDEAAEVLQSFTSDRVLLKSAIDRIDPSQRATRLKTAFELTEAKALAFFNGARSSSDTAPDVWLFSDGRALDRDELVLKSAKLKEYVAIGSEKAANVALVALSARRNLERPDHVQVFVRLANYGPEVATASAQLSIDGRVPTGGVRRGIKIAPERWTPKDRENADRTDKSIGTGGVEFEIELTQAAVVKVEVKDLANDMLPVDDGAQIVVPPPRTLNVLLVSRKGNYWIEQFMRAENLRSPAKLTPAEYREKMSDPQALARDYDVIIFDCPETIDRPKSLPPAGNFIFFNAVPPDTKMSIATNDGEEVILPDQPLLDWQRTHPILKGLTLRFYAAQTLKLQLPAEAQVLVEGKRGPLAVLYREGRRAHLVFPFDIMESSLPTNRDFPGIMHNALEFMALGAEMDMRQSYRPGVPIQIPRYAIQAAGTSVKSIRVSGPPGFDDADFTVSDAGDFAVPGLPRVGIYTLDPAIPQFEKLAVNLLDENESNVQPLLKAPGGAVSSEGQANTVVTTAGEGKSQRDLWWWIVAAIAVPLCLIEWWVYTRRVHL